MVEPKKSFHTGGHYSPLLKDRAGHEQMHRALIANVLAWLY